MELHMYGHANNALYTIIQGGYNIREGPKNRYGLAGNQIWQTVVDWQWKRDDPSALVLQLNSCCGWFEREKKVRGVSWVQLGK